MSRLPHRAANFRNARRNRRGLRELPRPGPSAFSRARRALARPAHTQPGQTAGCRTNAALLAMSCGLQRRRRSSAGQLLISDQVTALKNSECWRQSGGEITCTNCHNPHQDAPHAVMVARAEKTCLRCHSATVTKHAGLCPVNRRRLRRMSHAELDTRRVYLGRSLDSRPSRTKNRSACSQSSMANHDYSQSSVSPHDCAG